MNSVDNEDAERLSCPRVHDFRIRRSCLVLSSLVPIRSVEFGIVSTRVARAKKPLADCEGLFFFPGVENRVYAFGKGASEKT
jgi:hypothetical protein